MADSVLEAYKDITKTLLEDEKDTQCGIGICEFDLSIRNTNLEAISFTSEKYSHLYYSYKQSRIS